MRRFSRVLVLGLVGCGARTALPDALDDGEPIVVVEEDADGGLGPPAPLPEAGATTCPKAERPPNARACRAELLVRRVRLSSPTCFVDLLLREGEGATLEWDCADPDGAAVVVTDRGVLLGRSDGDRIDVCTGTFFDYSDGCTWASAQRISGRLDDERFVFTYTEAPVSGSGCARPCTASAELVVR